MLQRSDLTSTSSSTWPWGPPRAVSLRALSRHPAPTLERSAVAATRSSPRGTARGPPGRW